MSDEEESGNKFDRHSPSWRTAPLTLLCRCLDKRWMDDPLAAKRLPRVNGNPTEREPPENERFRNFIQTEHDGDSSADDLCN